MNHDIGQQEGPQVIIRKIAKDNIDLVLSNVDLAYVNRQLLQLNKHVISIINSIPFSLANSLRRVIISEIPTIG